MALVSLPASLGSRQCTRRSQACSTGAGHAYSTRILPCWRGCEQGEGQDTKRKLRVLLQAGTLALSPQQPHSPAIACVQRVWCLLSLTHLPFVPLRYRIQVMQRSVRTATEPDASKRSRFSLLASPAPSEQVQPVGFPCSSWKGRFSLMASPAASLCAGLAFATPVPGNSLCTPRSRCTCLEHALNSARQGPLGIEDERDGAHARDHARAPACQKGRPPELEASLCGTAPCTYAASGHPPLLWNRFSLLASPAPRGPQALTSTARSTRRPGSVPGSPPR